MAVSSKPVETGDFTKEDTDIPRVGLFNTLIDMWVNVDPEERNRIKWADSHGVTSQQIGNWSSRGAPWWAVMILCGELGQRVQLSPTGIYLKPAPKTGAAKPRTKKAPKATTPTKKKTATAKATKTVKADDVAAPNGHSKSETRRRATQTSRPTPA